MKLVARHHQMVKKNYLQSLHTVFTVSVVMFFAVVNVAAQNGSDTQGRDAASKALNDIRQNMTISRERMAELGSQVDSLKKDQRTLTTELVKTAKLERELSDNIAKNEATLAQLLVQKSDVAENLKSRRAEFAEVLAALERMGLNPPPAILVRPDDALVSVRSSVLLGALVPEMREKTLALSSSLKELQRITASISTEHDKLKAEVTKQAEQQKTLGLLLSEKSKLQKTSESELISQRKSTYEMVEKAKSLEELLRELDRQSRAPQNNTTDDSNLKLAQNLNFEQAKNHLIRPVSGKLIQAYGSGPGNFSQGEIIETSLGAIVTSPADGVVIFQGKFRSYGDVVILDVGQGYNVLLAGMGRIDVVKGQFVLSGEPIGAIGTQFIASAASLDIGKRIPMLYIEFIKQGKPVNPAPWWMAGVSGRNQNDS